MSSERLDEPDRSRQAILELLPKDTPLHRYVQWACAAHGSPAIYHLGTALALTLYELTWRGFRLPRIVDAGEYPLTAQFLLIGHSATGKTTAFNAMQDFANTVWATAMARPELEPWLELEGSVEGVTFAIQERFCEALDITPVILFDPEISKVFARRDSIVELLCKLADGRTIQSNYRGKQQRGSDKLINPRICGVYCTTEAQLAPHFKDQHRMGGMFPRLIWLRPDFKREDIWLSQDHLGAKPLGKVRERAVEEWIAWLAQLDLLAVEQGKRFEFSETAHAVLHTKLFEPFRTSFEHEAVDDNMHGVRMRLLEKARVFAAMHAALRYSMRVEAEDVNFAAALTQLFLSMLAEKSPLRDLGSSDDFRTARKVEELIRVAADHGLLRREIYRRMRVSKKTLEEALNLLIDREVIFVDNADVERTGRYVHMSSPLGQQLRADAADNAKKEAEMRSALGKRPTWRA